MAVNLCAAHKKTDSYNYLLYKAEKPSVCLTVTPISQRCMHRLKPDLLEMKAESSGTAKYIFKTLHVRLLIHTSALKALV